jgi:methylthioxylose transferase
MTSPAVSRRWAPWVGLLVTLVLLVVAFGLPHWHDWEVAARAPRNASPLEVPPLHGLWEPKLFGPGTLPAIAIALLGWRYAADLAGRLPWRHLLLASYVVSLVWLLSLALVDGTDGLSRVLGNPYEYLGTARQVGDVSTLLNTYVDRIPYAADDNWPTHVAGHPPALLLFFVALVRIGLGGDLAAGVVVTVLAASTAAAVLVTLRALGAEVLARRAAPFLVLTPAAVFMAVSADAVITAVTAWGIATLALAATTTGKRAVGWAALSGLLLGLGVLMSYGMPLMGVLAIAVLVAARSWRPLPVAVIVALGVVLTFAALGFAWWDAYPVLKERYFDGIAADRPIGYWWWGNLAALAASAGPLLGAGLASLRRSSDRVALLLVGAAVLMVALADVSGMSKAETERIWLPFIPWLTISMALLSSGWRRWGLGLQVLWALVVQHLFYTVW